MATTVTTWQPCSRPPPPRSRPTSAQPAGTAARRCSRSCARRSSPPTTRTPAARLGLDAARRRAHAGRAGGAARGPLDEVLARHRLAAGGRRLRAQPGDRDPAAGGRGRGRSGERRRARHRSVGRGGAIPQRREARLVVGVLRDGTERGPLLRAARRTADRATTICSPVRTSRRTSWRRCSHARLTSTRGSAQQCGTGLPCCQSPRGPAPHRAGC